MLRHILYTNATLAFDLCALLRAMVTCSVMCLGTWSVTWFQYTSRHASRCLCRRRRKFYTSVARSDFPFLFAMAKAPKREKYYLYNTLSILLKAVEKQRATVELRNETTIDGIVDHADA